MTVVSSAVENAYVVDSTVDAFRALVERRRSVRQFAKSAVSRGLIQSVVEFAQLSPSNCNTQPWEVHILSGSVRDRFSQLCHEAAVAGQFSMDFSFSTGDYPDVFAGRARAQGAAYYEALGIAREDFDERKSANNRNLDFFDAPHVALLFMPSVGDDVRIAGDMGMYGQTFLLSLAAHGLAGTPQTYLGFFAKQARQLLSLSDDHKLLFGISFGYADPDHLAGKYSIGRAPISESVTFHD